MHTEEITTRQIYDLLLEFRKEMTGELGGFKTEMYSFRDEMYLFKKEMYSFKKEMYSFKKEITGELSSFKTETTSRFEKLEHKIDKIECRSEKRFDNIDLKLLHLEEDLFATKKIVSELWQNKDKVSVSFNRTFYAINTFLATVVAIIVAMFTGKYTYQR